MGEGVEADAPCAAAPTPLEAAAPSTPPERVFEQSTRTPVRWQAFSRTIVRPSVRPDICLTISGESNTCTDDCAILKRVFDGLSPAKAIIEIASAME